MNMVKNGWYLKYNQIFSQFTHDDSFSRWFWMDTVRPKAVFAIAPWLFSYSYNLSFCFSHAQKWQRSFKIWIHNSGSWIWQKKASLSLSSLSISTCPLHPLYTTCIVQLYPYATSYSASESKRLLHHKELITTLHSALFSTEHFDVVAERC